MDQDKLNSVKEIIESPKFKSYDKTQQNEVLEEIIATGEVPRHDVMVIYNGSIIDIPYLERLPYTVFLNVVINGRIAGKELISLCNSSKLIQQQCNKPFTVEDTRETIPEYLFFLLLKDTAIDYNKIRQRRPNLSPRDVYFYYTVGDGVSYYRLDDKISYLVDMFGNEEYAPNDLFELLYGDEDGNLGFLRWMVQQLNLFEYKRFDWIIGIIYQIFKEFEDILLEKGGLYDIDKMSNELGLTPEELLLNNYDQDLVNPDRMASFKELFPGIEFNLENYIEIVRNYPEYYRHYLLTIPKITDHQTLLGKAEILVDNINRSIQTTSNYNYDKSKLLDSQDIEYLIRLHLRVLNGELKINTKFDLNQLL
jgi:hypothetical protein